MGKLLWHTMMSLDGFVAGAEDDMDWVFGVDGGDGQTMNEVVRSTGALLVGRRTQDVEDRLQPGFYGGAFSGPFFVLRHAPPSEPPVVKGVITTSAPFAASFAIRIASSIGTSRNCPDDGAPLRAQTVRRLNPSGGPVRM